MVHLIPTDSLFSDQCSSMQFLWLCSGEIPYKCYFWVGGLGVGGLDDGSDDTPVMVVVLLLLKLLLYMWLARIVVQNNSLFKTFPFPCFSLSNTFWGFAVFTISFKHTYESETRILRATKCSSFDIGFKKKTFSRLSTAADAVTVVYDVRIFDVAADGVARVIYILLII